MPHDDDVTSNLVLSTASASAHVYKSIRNRSYASDCPDPSESTVDLQCQGQIDEHL